MLSLCNAKAFLRAGGAPWYKSWRASLYGLSGRPSGFATQVSMADDSRGKHDDGKLLYCSFCGKSQHEVRKLIAGPSVFVCDECVELCNDIIREELEEKAEKTREKLPKPHEIKKSSTST